MNCNTMDVLTFIIIKSTVNKYIVNAFLCPSTLYTSKWLRLTFGQLFDIETTIAKGSLNFVTESPLRV